MLDGRRVGVIVVVVRSNVGGSGIVPWMIVDEGVVDRMWFRGSRKTDWRYPTLPM